MASSATQERMQAFANMRDNMAMPDVQQLNKKMKFSTLESPQVEKKQAAPEPPPKVTNAYPPGCPDFRTMGTKVIRDWLKQRNADFKGCLEKPDFEVAALNHWKKFGDKPAPVRFQRSICTISHDISIFSFRRRCIVHIQGKERNHQEQRGKR